MEGHGDRDWHVDADHSCLDSMSKVACGVTVAGEDGGSVAKLVVVDQLQCSFEVVCSYNSKDWAEDFFAVDLHLRFDVIEEAGAEKEALIVGQGVFASVND